MRAPTEKEPPPHSKWRQMREAIDGCWIGKGGVCVVSEVADARSPVDGIVIPQWLLSISRVRKQPTARDIKRALRDFGMSGAAEDIIPRGQGRHFWLPIDPAHRDRAGREGCRGCNIDSICPIHGGDE